MGESPEQEIENLEVELAQAMLHNDVAALDKFLSDEVIFTDPQGDVIDKAQDLTLHQSGGLVVTTYETADLIIRVFGSTAITNLKARVGGMFKGSPFYGVYRYTRTYLKEHGKWRIIAAQATAIASEGGIDKQ
ncbi:MAG: nuclear transport factor 2 family protein [Mojavia pulchra JT2-VF2]|jgi:ketosteroid isomerase-like protein|uniref:Nuclear transport factor 2 family protein n=1 Tax=Mojavia pulchra JT2-VF2 TaxID=287848 RepID=A0A951UHP6_9NOST|nr:nuclear transport factor 2 family protein [Mojavia pulchra JT2-VF2]